jgi:hypothetical protein
MILHRFEEASQDVLDQLAQIDLRPFTRFCDVSVIEQALEKLEYGWLRRSFGVMSAEED